MKFNGVMLGSDNADALGEFYTKVLGKPDMKADGWYGFWKSGIGLMIGSHSEVKGKNDMPGRIMLTFEVDDIQAEFKRIEGTGAKVVAKPYQPSKKDAPEAWLATFADPDGNYFQLATPWKS